MMRDRLSTCTVFAGLSLVAMGCGAPRGVGEDSGGQTGTQSTCENGQGPCAGGGAGGEPARGAVVAAAGSNAGGAATTGDATAGVSSAAVSPISGDTGGTGGTSSPRVGVAIVVSRPISSETSVAVASGDSSAGAAGGPISGGDSGAGGEGLGRSRCSGGAGAGGVLAAGGEGGVLVAGGAGGAGYTGPWPPSESYTNPVLWEDLADIDIFRVDDVFYYSASNMHYSPGAPILRSYDLVNWEYAGHSVPVLDFAPKYDMMGGTAYVKGTWASFLNYRKSNGTFYWGGCIEFSQTYIYTATSVEGPWEKHPAINNCYYDPGLLIDDDDTMYVAYGITNIRVAQLSSDGLSEVVNQVVFTSPSSIGTLEGARFYKINGSYYILLTRPPDGEFVLKASDPFGPYEIQPLVDRIGTPTPGTGHPHQGGIVETQNGDWYYMAFIDAFPGGRIPVLAPITWDADGWPSVQLDNGTWGSSYPYPDVPAPPREVKPRTGIDTFSGTTLGHEWEWNHNPDNTKWSLDNGIHLQTATVTTDLYKARNTLTHRILGPTSTATIELDYSAMADGDIAGLALLRDLSAWVGIKKEGGSTRVVMVNGLTMDSSWNTTGTGTEVESIDVSGGTLWLRVAADINPAATRRGHFSYSTDGTTFEAIGSPFPMGADWPFFMGYRYAIFNYATQALGGVVTVGSFEVTDSFDVEEDVVESNLVANGDFESGTQGWGTWNGGALLASTDRAHGGDQSLVVTNRVLNAPAATNITSGVSPATSYLARFWVSIDGAPEESPEAPVNVTEAITCQGEPTQYTRLVDTVIVQEDEWVELVGSLDLPDCTLTDVTVFVEGPGENIDLYVDDVVIHL